MRGSGILGRLLAAILGGVMAIAGLATIATGDPQAVSVGIWIVVIGIALIIVAVLERLRYRSEAADAAGLPTGPGGGEPFGEPLEGRFGRTDEVFVDPTSGRRMRVWLDGTTGERRYRAED